MIADARGRARGLRRALFTCGILVGLGFLVAAVSAGLLEFQEQTFPHAAHEGLFPTCTGCHEAPALGERPGYPDAALCAECHDGVDLSEVTWPGPTFTASNVTFDHTDHAFDLEAVGEPSPSCEGCHTPVGGARMDVVDRVEEDACFSCHVSGADGHFSAGASGSAACALCHVPLAESGFPVERIEALPVPADHERGSFVSEDHGSSAASGIGRCATCHTRDRCLACHVDAGTPLLEAVPPAPADMELPPAPAGYPLPDTHRVDRFAQSHAPVAQPAECATCHTRDDCRSCHVVASPALVDALPDRRDTRAPGVGLTRSAPGSHESPFFPEAHGTLAGSDDATCATCHTEGYCTDCHGGPAGSSYHPDGFASGHSTAA